jgi:hypothetical protein
MASPTMEICSSFSSVQVAEQIFKTLRSEAIQAGKTSKVGVEFVQLTIFLRVVANQVFSVKKSSIFFFLLSILIFEMVQTV